LAQLQNELTCVVAEKIQLEERMSCATEEASVKTKGLEDEGKQLKEMLANADELERMLAMSSRRSCS